MLRKTKLMQRVERERQRPLERLLTELVNQQGLSRTADDLGVSKATLGYWLLKLGITVIRVALSPGETIEIRRQPGPHRAALGAGPLSSGATGEVERHG